MHETHKTDNMKLTSVNHDLYDLTQIIESVVKEVLGEHQPIQKQETKKAIYRDINQDIVQDINQDVNRVVKQDINRDINLEQAIALIEKVEKQATLLGQSVVTAVYSSAARPIAIHCMDNSLIASFDVAINKAYTSAALKMSTAVLKNLSQPGQELYGIQHTNEGKIIIFGGGEPLIYNGKLLGALGVSGGTEEEDTKLAEFGKNKLKEVMMW